MRMCTAPYTYNSQNVCICYMEFRLKIKTKQKVVIGTREIAQRLRELAALPKDSGSIPSTHVVAHNCLHLKFQEIQYPLTDKHSDKTPMHTK